MRRQEFKECSVPRCERQHTAKGFCAVHLEQFKRGKTPVEQFKPLPAKPECEVAGCDRPAYCKKGCRTHYGMTLMFKIGLGKISELYAQGCGICEATRDLHIDHDHTCCPGNYSCGKCIRGALCSSCNMALGGLGDSLEGLERAIQYLKKYATLVPTTS